MPEISRFYGLSVFIYWDEGSHHIPHFHVKYNEYEASIAIENYRFIQAGNQQKLWA